MSNKKIFAFAGSNSSKSINRQLVKHALKRFKEFEINFVDLNNFEMPIYSMDREEKDGIPDKAMQFRSEIQVADAIVCSLAEHNRSYTVAFKNVLDWCSRVDLKIFDDKPMLLMSASTGGYGGGNVMNMAKSFFPKCSADVVETFSLPTFKKNFENGEISDKELSSELDGKIDLFLEQFKIQS